MCAALLSQGGVEVQGWSGTIAQQATTRSGQGVVAVRIARNGTLRSRDTDDGYTEGVSTLIPFDSPLFRTVATMRSGQQVRFDGRFFPDTEDCVRELSPALREGMREPEFLFRFTDIRPAE
jgi:hypothetical protein